jgi:cell division protein FtsL
MATRALPRESHAPRLRVVRGHVRPRNPSRIRRTRGSIPIVVLAALTVFAVAVLQAWMGQEGLKAAKLERAVAHQTEQTTLLRAKVAQLETPKRIADEARRLGLVADPNPAFLQEVDAAPDQPPTTPDQTKRLTSPSP